MGTTARALLLLTAAALAGCAPMREKSAGATRDPKVITADEVRTTQWTNAFDVVQMLRPAWLRKRGVNTIVGEPGEIAAYMGRTRLGGPAALRDIQAAGIRRIEFLDASEAQFRFGLDHPHGAIVVTVGG